MSLTSEAGLAGRMCTAAGLCSPARGIAVVIQTGYEGTG